MTDGALASANTYAQVRVREPIGDRTLGETPTIGGEGSDIVVPGVDPGNCRSDRTAKRRLDLQPRQ